MSARPLQGVRIVDLSTLLPGPLATLILAEAGAEVVKVERPGGDELRSYPPHWGPDGASFQLLNRGKRGIVLDLKDPAGRDALLELVRDAHVLVEQFRPGVMDRLGLGWDTLRQVNPKLVYCAITGYGQTGPKAHVAAHDLNYMADAGLLARSAGSDGTPGLPPVLAADIGGGSLPAVINILLALRKVEQTGEGCFLDIAMGENLFAWSYDSFSQTAAGQRSSGPGQGIFNGGSPRYQVYRCGDGRFLAAAPLEQKFWETFCTLIQLPAEFRDDSRDPAATIRAVTAIIAAAPAAHWETLFTGRDVCCTIVRSLEAALEDPHFKSRGLFGSTVTGPAGPLAALPVPIAPSLRNEPGTADYPPRADQAVGNGRG